MTSPKSTPEVSFLSGQQEEGDKKDVDNDKKTPNARNGRRSAFAAFGDEDSDSVESPARKKQNMGTSIAHLQAIENRSSITDASVENDVQNLLDNDPRYFDVDSCNSPVDGQIMQPPLPIENDDATKFDLLPPTSFLPTKMTAVTTASNTSGVDKMTGVEKKVEGPRNVEHDNLKSTNPDDTASYHCSTKNNNSRKARIRYENGDRWWVGIFFLANTFVLAGMIFSGLLLNERSIYQLKSMECMNRLHLAYQAMDLTFQFESVDGPNDENNISNRFDEHEFYWKELEAQVRYWKKEAKKYQQYGDGYKVQCQADLQHLLPEIDPQKEVNSSS